MTALLLSQIPSDINTVEKLAVWAVKALAKCNPNARTNILLSDNSVLTQRTIGDSIITDDNGIVRLAAVLYLPLNSDWAIDKSVKLWGHALEVGTVGLSSQITTP